MNQKYGNVQIVCRTETPSKFKFSWLFDDQRGEDYSQQHSVIEETDDCKDKSGPYQLRFRPNTLVVCRMNFTIHQGTYTCIVEDGNKTIKESKSMRLTIQGLFFLR